MAKANLVSNLNRLDIYSGLVFITIFSCLVVMVSQGFCPVWSFLVMWSSPPCALLPEQKSSSLQSCLLMPPIPVIRGSNYMSWDLREGGVCPAVTALLFFLFAPRVKKAVEAGLWHWVRKATKSSGQKGRFFFFHLLLLGGSDPAKSSASMGTCQNISACI